MVNPQFIEEQHVTLSEVKVAVDKIEKRDKELNYRTNKVKDFLAGFDNILAVEKKEKLQKKLQSLGLTRLKEEHIVKFVDFLPKNLNELKAILAAYPLSLTKKDQEAIVEAVAEFTS